MSVFNSAWKDTTEWNAKETKMFCQYITRFTSKIQEIFRITVQPSDSEEEIKHKEDTFNFVTDELKRIMEKRHYVRNKCYVLILCYIVTTVAEQFYCILVRDSI